MDKFGHERKVSSRRRFLGGALAAGALSMVDGLPAQGSPLQDAPKVGKTPHTRFAINVEIWFGRHPFLERLDRVAELGFPAIEFWPWRGKDIDAIAERTKKLGLEVAQFTAWGFEPGMNDPRNHERFVAEVRESLDVASRLGAKQMTVVGGNDQPGMTEEEMHGHIVTALKLAAPHAEKAGVTLILEPMNIRVDHKGHCLYGSAKAVRICRAVGSKSVKINWDLYHMQISEGDLCGRLKEGFDQLGYVQLADHPGRHEPGTGEIHYNRVLKELFDLGYRGCVGAELWPSKGEVEAAKSLSAADVW